MLFVKEKFLAAFLAGLSYVGVSNRIGIKNHATDYIITNLIGWAGGAESRWEILCQKVHDLKISPYPIQTPVPVESPPTLRICIYSFFC